jgi:chromosome segregation ATPase
MPKNDAKEAIEKFKMNVLLKLQGLELKIINLDEDKDEIKTDLKELKNELENDIDELKNKIESFRESMPHPTTNKIMFTVFGATVSFLFAMVLLFFGGIIK